MLSDLSKQTIDAVIGLMADRRNPKLTYEEVPLVAEVLKGESKSSLGITMNNLDSFGGQIKTFVLGKLRINKLMSDRFTLPQVVQFYSRRNEGEFEIRRLTDAGFVRDTATTDQVADFFRGRAKSWKRGDIPRGWIPAMDDAETLAPTGGDIGEPVDRIGGYPVYSLERVPIGGAVWRFSRMRTLWVFVRVQSAWWQIHAVDSAKWPPTIAGDLDAVLRGAFIAVGVCEKQQKAAA